VQKSLHIDPNKCTGCLQCEIACSFENYGVFNRAKSRIKVFEFHETGRKVPYTCTQCDEAWCMHACPVDAIVGAAKLMHTVVTDLCTGCDLCIAPCPVDCIEMVPAVGADASWVRERADAARARFERRNARLELERKARRERLAARALKAKADPDAEKKRAIIQAAIERARLRRAQP